MSIEAMSWALTVPLGGNAKVVLLGLANHAHPDGTSAYPALTTLAVYAHCDRSTARRNCRRLADDGWIERTGVGPNGQNEYRLCVERDTERVSEPVEVSTPSLRVCVYCGGDADVLDHVDPLANGGGEEGNRAPACGACNSSKGVNEWREWATGRGFDVAAIERRLVPWLRVAKRHPQTPQGGGTSASEGVAPAPPEPSLVNRPKEEDAYASKKKDGLSDVDAVLAHFAEVMRPRRKEFGEQERAIVRDALKVASVEELCDCITSCERSDFHMKRGAYASHPPGPGRKYNRVSDIFRGRQGTRTTREQVDMFLDRLTSDGGGSVPSEENARVRQAKRSVLTAWEFSGDELLVNQGEEAAVWLAQHGWTVHRDGPNGRPRFDRA